MVEIGYALSSEEHGPRELVRHAALAEEAGFGYALISDHYHPWTDSQGHSPFVWSVIGGIAGATERLRLGTGVTAPIMRIHPAILAQATATVGNMMEGRFFWGIGTGEALNEHILGQHWPPVSKRLAMLEEAVALVRRLWEGGYVTHYGEHFTVENARIYDTPEQPIEIHIAAGGPEAARLAGRIGDGYIGTAPDKETLEAFDEAGGRGKPKYGQVTVCWAADEGRARRMAKEIWPTAALHGQMSQELPLPQHFMDAAKDVTEEKIAEMVVCGPDAERHIEQIQTYVDAGYTHIYVHQIGPDQEGFLRFYRQEVVPAFERELAGAGSR